MVIRLSSSLQFLNDTQASSPLMTNKDVAKWVKEQREETDNLENNE
jgi:hypothetical protein